MIKPLDNKLAYEASVEISLEEIKANEKTEDMLLNLFKAKMDQMLIELKEWKGLSERANEKS